MKPKLRIHHTAIFVMVGLIILVSRLAYIQLFATESFSKHHVNLIEESVQQRTQGIVLDNGRGRFVDRNGDPLYNDYYPSLILFPFLKQMEWPVDEVARIIGTRKSYLEETVQLAEGPVVLGGDQPLRLSETQMNELNDLKVPGIIATYYETDNNSISAEHFIGIVRENEELLKERYEEKLEKGYISTRTPIGITGLQRAFDEFLVQEGEAKLLYHVDNQGQPLFGLNVKYTAPSNPFYPLVINTTLEKKVQDEAERLIDESGLKKGGLVLLDIQSRDVLAMVSRPHMDMGNPFQNDGGKNYMILPQVPGSIFKIVTATAAIENVDLRGRRFNCDLNLYGDKPASRLLGQLDFVDSFAQSCNNTFAELANEMISVNDNIIDEYAEKLGLTTPVGWNGEVFHYRSFSHFPEEVASIIWKDERDKGAERAIAQTAIGQKEVRISPLAVANMVATIADDGRVKQVRGVDKIIYKNGAVLFEFPKQTLADEKLSPYTISKLQQLLREVVESGTGKVFRTLPYTVAGKSGTAEIGSTGYENKWFVGYFPVERPRYALVVVNMQVNSWETQTNDVFADMVKIIHNLNNDL
ncbi:peptidoglycan D,D-transpeptidase FtsI family protein [Bacillus solimangrovi]|uniref:Penicillin-binding protein n=1 Tax=Bacillus solimangrovi TaxID=1305675 RepID=A0A1E5LBS5_9BACI|nr:penicillin-binding transpeptidase domain-containing protein [Bacillus solimangrovi]OEH91523.1 penicillin-binding protein [Bacillus solimangrovi]